MLPEGSDCALVFHQQLQWTSEKMVQGGSIYSRRICSANCVLLVDCMQSQQVNENHFCKLLWSLAESIFLSLLPDSLRGSYVHTQHESPRAWQKYQELILQKDHPISHFTLVHPASHRMRDDFHSSLTLGFLPLRMNSVSYRYVCYHFATCNGF